MSVVYVEELFGLNLAIDYFLLLGTAKVCALPLRRRRYAASAALGSVWCCLALLPGLSWLGSGVMKTVLAVGICLAAFGREGRLWRSFGVFLGLSALFGGAVWAAGLQRGVWRADGCLVRLDMRVLALSFAVCWAGIGLVFRRAAAKCERELPDVCIDRHGRSVTLRALRDTGNDLRDPLTGRRVLVAESDALAPLFDKAERRALKSEATEAVLRLQGFHLIPYASLGGSGLLLCFRPERVTVNGEARDDLAVALAPTALDPDGEYRAIL